MGIYAACGQQRSGHTVNSSIERNVHSLCELDSVLLLFLLVCLFGFGARLPDRLNPFHINGTSKCVKVSYAQRCDESDLWKRVSLSQGSSPGLCELRDTNLPEHLHS